MDLSRMTSEVDEALLPLLADRVRVELILIMQERREAKPEGGLDRQPDHARVAGNIPCRVVIGITANGKTI
jgi:hypothetical protein